MDERVGVLEENVEELPVYIHKEIDSTSLSFIRLSSL